jgi:hypothetical protein
MNSTPVLPTNGTTRSVISGPISAPVVPPAAITPNRRWVCATLNSSSRKLQNTETMNRFSTLIQT